MVETGNVRSTLLPGWTNAHLLCHVERNAASHVRMLEATLKGDLVDQYSGGASGRQAEIDSGSHRPLGVLASALETTDRQLEAQWHLMDRTSWHSSTRARAGIRPAYSCLWARWREVELHAVDFGTDVDVLDWPTDFATAGLDVSFRGLELRPVQDRLPPGVHLELRDTGMGSWQSSQAEPTHVGEGSVQQLLGWVVGRLEWHNLTWTGRPPDLEEWP